MKTTRPWAQGIVLSGFVLLLSGFVAYRSGAFDKFTQPAQVDDGGLIQIADITLADTTVKPDTNPPRTMMYSSKSMVLPKSDVLPPHVGSGPVLLMDTIQFLKLYRDLQKIKRDDSIWQVNRRIQASSSKSARILETNDMKVRYVEPVFINGQYRTLTIYEVDRLISEMNKKYPFASKDSIIEITSPVTVMPSSKSGSIISPKEYKIFKKAQRKLSKGN